MLPGNRATGRIGFTDKTVVEVLVGKHPPERKLHCSMLELYEKYLFRYDGGCGQVSYAETSGERRARWHGLRGFTGVANKIGYL